MRAYFILQLREINKPKSGSGGCAKTTTKWAFYNQILFLKDVLTSSDDTMEDSLTNPSEYANNAQTDEASEDLDDSLVDLSMLDKSEENYVDTAASFIFSEVASKRTPLTMPVRKPHSKATDEVNTGRMLVNKRKRTSGFH